jgi:uncharacterized repeat protein (TIGR01451 family)
VGRGGLTPSRVEVVPALFAVSKRTIAFALGVVALSFAGWAAAGLTQGDQGHGIPLVRAADKVTICHATSSDKNPYVQLDVPIKQIFDANGHDTHPDDIIPPFDYVEGGDTKQYPGKNWEAEGIAIWENGCEPTTTTTTTPTTPTTETTSTTTPTTSTTTPTTSTTTPTTSTTTPTTSTTTPTTPTPPLPELVPIGLFVTCVTNHAGTYDAVFGYTNDNRAQQVIPLGLANTFVPAPGNRGQPTTFEPGTVRDAVRVNGIPNGTLLVWGIDFLGNRVAVASEFLPNKCADTPLPPPPPPPKPPQSGLFGTCILRLGAPTYDAIFGYANASGRDVLIPVGRRNFVAPAPVNRGQPTVFRPGVVRFAFAVRNIPLSRRLTWTVSTVGGESRTATVTARYPRNCIIATPAPSADLVLTKSVAPTQVSAGHRVTYTIHVTNRGPNIALRVRIADVLDPRLELLSASSTRGSCSTSGQRVSCRIVALPPGAGVTIVVAARARGGGTIRNVAVARHSRGDPTRRNNVDSSVLHVTGASGAVPPSFTG